MEARSKQVERRSRLAKLAALLATVMPASVATDGLVALRPGLTGPPAELQDGDIVFRRGVDAIGRMVLSYGDRPRFSHVGMLVRDDGGTFVVHALPETSVDDGGVQLDRLGAFNSPLRAADVGYYRVRQLSLEQRREIHRFLIAQVGRPFDLRFKYSTDDAVYCTELVLKALAQVGVELTPTLEAIQVILVDEPVFAPDALRQSELLQDLVSTTM